MLHGNAPLLMLLVETTCGTWSSRLTLWLHNTVAPANDLTTRGLSEESEGRSDFHTAQQ